MTTLLHINNFKQYAYITHCRRSTHADQYHTSFFRKLGAFYLIYTSRRFKVSSFDRCDACLIDDN